MDMSLNETSFDGDMTGQVRRRFKMLAHLDLTKTFSVRLLIRGGQFYLYAGRLKKVRATFSKISDIIVLVLLSILKKVLREPDLARGPYFVHPCSKW
jgi:hypothetical protein